MPCNDVTDFLKLTIDHHDRIVNYRLTKRTCGAEVGEISLISHWVKKRHIDEILETTAETFLETKVPRDATEEFLFLKHFFSIQKSLQSLLGITKATEQDDCTIDQVEQDGDLTHVSTSLKVDLMTNKIKSCSGCGCTKKRKEVHST